MIEFEGFPKIARLRRPVVITEKIDGTNGAIVIADDGLTIAAQSRNRLITPQDDNFGFAKWVYNNADTLIETLGPGRHFGEWWGQGIGRGYGLKEKRFSLFNVSRWTPAAGEYEGYDGALEAWSLNPDIGLYVVPTIFDCVPFDQMAYGGHEGYVEDALYELRKMGSFAAPGFMRPEGVIVFHTASRSLFKVTLENDEVPKGFKEAA